VGEYMRYASGGQNYGAARRFYLQVAVAIVVASLCFSALWADISWATLWEGSRLHLYESIFGRSNITGRFILLVAPLPVFTPAILGSGLIILGMCRFGARGHARFGFLVAAAAVVFGWCAPVVARAIVDLQSWTAH
jgi:hypothetical protein